MPLIIYGTAWKEDSTAELVKQAVNCGYRGIDTANQKKHYREDFAGQALKSLMGSQVQREELFLQSLLLQLYLIDRHIPEFICLDHLNRASLC